MTARIVETKIKLPVVTPFNYLYLNKRLSSTDSISIGANER